MLAAPVLDLHAENGKVSPTIPTVPHQIGSDGVVPSMVEKSCEHCAVAGKGTGYLEDFIRGAIRRYVAWCTDRAAVQCKEGEPAVVLQHVHSGSLLVEGGDEME